MYTCRGCVYGLPHLLSAFVFASLLLGHLSPLANTKFGLKVWSIVHMNRPRMRPTMWPTPFVRLSRSSRSKLNAAFHATLIIAAAGNARRMTVLTTASKQDVLCICQISRHISRTLQQMLAMHGAASLGPFPV